MDDLAAKVAAAVEAKKQAQIQAAMQQDQMNQENEKFAQLFANMLVPAIQAAITNANIGLSGTGLLIDGRQEPPIKYVCVLHGQDRPHSIEFHMVFPGKVLITADTSIFHASTGRSTSTMHDLAELNQKMVDSILLTFVTAAIDRT